MRRLTSFEDLDDERPTRFELEAMANSNAYLYVFVAWVCCGAVRLGLLVALLLSLIIARSSTMAITSRH